MFVCAFFYACMSACVHVYGLVCVCVCVCAFVCVCGCLCVGVCVLERGTMIAVFPNGAGEVPFEVINMDE